MSQSHEYATLGGGCFWCLEAVYQEVKGVLRVTSGYAGGTKENANYSAVCSGSTQHAEVVQVQFDPEVISYAEILDIFWTIHDPTTPNQQGNDRGPQYRSAIFYHDEAQKTAAEQSIRETAPQLWDNPVVTQLAPLEAFYPAEVSHQDYYRKVGNRNPYCTFIITPKVKKFREHFADKRK
ncbi:MAG: peptide-methionine (S)-S-oxide reductase MsrA [Phaeodactylibacter sp.]|uniref:peptide-methionine (S)-S-oxide reductase MsrA n=1 Tax=Phaeodactylibacter sp. TaxID=1940289 RepID=UPI0032ED7530